MLFRFKTSWEYADVSRVGWQWSYDYSASMVCREDGCSVTKIVFEVPIDRRARRLLLTTRRTRQRRKEPKERDETG